MNLLKEGENADYVVTGVWSGQAFEEAKKYCTPNLAYKRKDDEYSLAPQSEWKQDPNSKYLYYCDNETANGYEFPQLPSVLPGQTLVADMTSNFLTKKIDFSKVGVVIAGAQKNIGAAGVTVVVVREDLLGSPMKITPMMCDYTHQEKFKSAYNTPPVFNIYLMNLYLQFVKSTGGLEQYSKLAEQKSSMIYKVIDESNGFYVCPILKEHRSRLNVCFTISEPKSTQGAQTYESFYAEARENCLNDLRGFKVVGGVRASIYNGMPLKGVQKLEAFMKSFQAKNFKANL